MSGNLRDDVGPDPLETTGRCWWAVVACGLVAAALIALPIIGESCG